MRLIGKRKYKFMALLILAIILFVLLAKIFIYMNYKPVKNAIGKSEINTKILENKTYSEFYKIISGNEWIYYTTSK